MAAPMDLGVTWTENKENLYRTVQNVIKLGYNTICINYVVDELKVKTSKKGKEQPVPLKQPQDILIAPNTLQVLANKHKVGPGPFRQVSRITVTISNHDQINRLQRDEVIRKYDVIAVRPTTDKLFMAACMTLDVDIISLELSEKGSFHFKRANVGQALERGVHFEVDYTSLIRDSSTRRNTIANATALIKVCKGKNVVLTSASRQAMEIRGPYDVANLGLLFGLKEQQAKATVSRNCLDVLLHAKGRQTACFTVALCKVDKLPASERSKLEGGAKPTVGSNGNGAAAGAEKCKQSDKKRSSEEEGGKIVKKQRTEAEGVS